MFPDFPDDNKNDDFLNEFRQKIAEQSNISFEERRNELNRSKSVFIGAVSGVVLAGIVGWFILSPQYAHNENVELPVIRRPQTAIKVQPTEPGGMEILNQDKSVYDILDKTKNNTQVVENLLPPPEQPKLPEIAPDLPTEESTNIVSAISSSEVIENAEKIISSEASSQDNLVEQIKTQTEKLDNSPKKQPEQPEQLEKPKKEVSSSNVSVYKAQIKEGKLVEKTSVPTSAPTGVWQVQLISSNNKASVEKSWTGLSKKYEVLSGVPYEIETADLGPKGVYYRLKAGAFENREGADKLCNDIKALGGTCFVKKK